MEHIEPIKHDEPTNSGTLMLMLYDESGVIESELAVFDVKDGLEYVAGYKAKRTRDIIEIALTLTVPGQVDDEAFDKIYDLYNTDFFDDVDVEIEEVGECENPTWLFSYIYTDGEENCLNDLIGRHKGAVADVMRQM